MWYLTTYVGFDQIAAMWYKVVVVFHVTPLLHSNEVFESIERAASTGGSEEFLDGHALSHPDRGRRALRQRHAHRRLAVLAGHLIYSCL